jgi:hypothetical protein
LRASSERSSRRPAADLRGRRRLVRLSSRTATGAWLAIADRGRHGRHAPRASARPRSDPLRAARRSGRRPRRGGRADGRDGARPRQPRLLRQRARGALARGDGRAHLGELRPPSPVRRGRRRGDVPARGPVHEPLGQRTAAATLR